jgi:hypothetical protein
MSKKYKIGEILVTKEDVELTSALSEKKTIVRKGTRIMIGADKLAHHFGTGIIQPLQDGDDVSGYDTEGIANAIIYHLGARFPLKEMFEDYDIDEEDFKDEIDFVLSEYAGM